jgi:hypothetical protein
MAARVVTKAACTYEAPEPTRTPSGQPKARIPTLTRRR